MKKVVIAIVVNNAKILMVRRKEREGDLYWQFPGGQLEENETESQAAEREVFEEIGLECKAIEKLGERVHPSTGRFISYWACSSVSTNANLIDAENDEVAWLNTKEVFQKVTSDIFEPVKKYILGLEN